MHLIFERGDRDAPVGHALIYFTADGGTILATYVSVPPIPFDLTKYVPPFLAGAFQDMNLGLGDSIMVPPVPPIPEEVSSIEYLHALATRRQDDLVYAGGVIRSDPARLAGETSEAATSYAELYNAVAPPVAGPSTTESQPVVPMPEMGEQEILNELTVLTGRLRDSLRNGGPDADIEQRLRGLASMLPPKYRAQELVEAACEPGDRGQKLAALRLERCYKLFNEDYLDLPRIDREIESIVES